MAFRPDREDDVPLLLCPNDNSGMQTVTRGEVEFDMCPKCRGVWLDRGELEKLLGAGREAVQSADTAREAFVRDTEEFRRNPQEWQRRHPYDPQQQRHRYDDDDDQRRHGYQKKKRGFDLFDMFD